MSLRSKWHKLKQKCSRAVPAQAVSKKQHQLIQQSLSKPAIDTLQKLTQAGYDAYLVGGCVRDVLLGHKPKDFDVATNATPEQITQVIRRSRIIGRRFQLVHVYHRDEVIEVSTFRANAQEPVPESEDTDVPLARRSDNTFGTLEEDAWRRDFTVNALYYCLEDACIIDHTGGMDDIKQQRMRIIGDPEQRFHEDPVRLLRAIRLAAKLGLQMEKKTEQQVLALPSLLAQVAPARLFDEVGKLFFTGHAVASYHLLQETGYFKAIFPAAAQALSAATDTRYGKLLELAMAETDRRNSDGLPLSPGYLLAVIFWPIVAEKQQELFQENNRYAASVHQAIRHAMMTVRCMLQIPKRFTGMMQAIWSLFYRLQQSPVSPARLERIMGQRYTRAGLDFLELQAAAGWDYREAVSWWRKRLPKREAPRFNSRRERGPGRSRDGRRNGSRRQRRR